MESGLVIATYRRHYDIALDDGEHVACVLKGRSLQIAVGDRVEIQRSADGGAIQAVKARTNLIYRSDAFKEKLLAAHRHGIRGVSSPPT